MCFMSRRIRIMVKDQGTNINFSLPIGLFTRLLRFGGDLANVFAKDAVRIKAGIVVKDFKVLANFIDELSLIEPFTLVEVEDGKTIVLIRTE
jgi:hypothetical protein